MVTPNSPLYSIGFAETPHSKSAIADGFRNRSVGLTVAATHSPQSHHMPERIDLKSLDEHDKH